MSTLEEYLNNYKDATLNIINNLNCDNIDSIDEYINRRQNMLDSIKSLEFTKDKINLICNELQIFELEKKLNELLRYKREKLRTEMDRISKVKNANISYNKNVMKNSIIFSKKI